MNPTLPGIPTALYGAPEIDDLYTVYPLVPRTALAARRMLRMLPWANAATLVLLGRVGIQGAHALGYLQENLRLIETVPRPAFAQEALGRVKVSTRQVGYFCQAKAGRQPTGGGAVQVQLSDSARLALAHLETWDPGLIRSRGPLDDTSAQAPFDLDVEFKKVLDGLVWPLEAL